MLIESVQRDIPAIYVALNEIDESALKQLYWGMEEEGVPFKIIPPGSQDIAADAYSAATNSPLTIGIACNQNEIALHMRNLSPDTPLYQFSLVSLNETRQLRHLGCNAARLVKGLPLKPITGNFQGGYNE